VERYKNTLLNLMIAPNAKGVLPKKKNVMSAIKVWLRTTFPPGQVGAPRTVENLETGEIRVIAPVARNKVPSPNVGSPGVKRISPLKVAKREPAFKRPRKPKPKGPAVGPIKAPPPGYSNNNSNNNSLSRNGSVNLNRLVK
jgi:hypothetical protein